MDFSAVRKAEECLFDLAGNLGIAFLYGSSSTRDGKYFNDVLLIDESGAYGDVKMDSAAVVEDEIFCRRDCLQSRL